MEPEEILIISGAILSLMIIGALMKIYLQWIFDVPKTQKLIEEQNILLKEINDKLSKT